MKRTSVDAWALFFLVVLAAGCNAQGTPERAVRPPEPPAEEKKASGKNTSGERAGRLEGSPYPASRVPDTLFVVADAGFTEGQRLTVETLQGVLAREQPQLYRREEGSGYDLWLQDVVERYGVVADDAFEDDYERLIRHFKGEIDGYVLCDPTSNSSNVAISLAGLSDVIAVTPDDEPLMNELGIPKYLDARGHDERWAFEAHGSSFSKDIVAYQEESKDVFLGDYSAFAGAFQFSAPLDGALADTAFARLRDGGALFGWGGERDLVSAASSHSVYVHPADFAQNLSTLTNFEAGDLEQNGEAEEGAAPVEDVHTVTFLMSDGDNLQWLLDDFATSENWFASPQRGQVDLGWTISPALSELAPTVMEHLYEAAAKGPSGSDSFVAAPSGVGYMYPNLFPALDTAAAQLNRYMEKADLSIVNVIGRNSDGRYLRPYLEQPTIDAIFYLDYTSYANPEGRLRWINGKPIVGARYDFREGTNSVEELAAKLNAAAKTPDAGAGYSLVTVHVWSRSVEDVVRVAELLDADVEVVRPDVFVRRMQEHVDR